MLQAQSRVAAPGQNGEGASDSFRPRRRREPGRRPIMRVLPVPAEPREVWRSEAEGAREPCGRMPPFGIGARNGRKRLGEAVGGILFGKGATGRRVFFCFS